MITADKDTTILLFIHFISRQIRQYHSDEKRHFVF